MHHKCNECGSGFEITNDDLAFYDKISPVFGGKKYDIPPPTRCPDCRFQRRVTFRNERVLYKNTCGLCKKPVVSIYKPSGVLVYCKDCYWGDKCDPLSYGLALSPTQPFLQQMKPLLSSVPFQSNIIINSVNCDYNCYAVNSKNCYLCQRVEAEDCMYSYLVLGCLGCTDCSYIYKSQYCYECVDTWNCYKTLFSQFCKNCQGCWFCYDCIGCSNCIGCTGQRQKEYMIFNKKVSPEEFERFVMNIRSYSEIQALRKQAQAVFEAHPRRALFQEQAENAYGDVIMKSRTIYEGYDVEESQDVRYARGVEYSKDIGDSDFIYYGELCYENMSNAHATSILFTAGAYNSQNLLYCVLCAQNSKDSFGCVGLRGQQYCILNTQYTQQEYQTLVPRIIEKMRTDGTWGEFFPPAMSYFGYNESVALEHFPLSKKEALDRGFTWSDSEPPPPEAQKVVAAAQLPELIEDTPDDILNWAITCEDTDKPFKIATQELDFYRQMHLPIPHLHPDQRHRRRMALRNPRKLWKRVCQKCEKEINTSYSPDRPAVRGSEEPSGSRREIVYCESCYLATVY